MWLVPTCLQLQPRYWLGGAEGGGQAADTELAQNDTWHRNIDNYFQKFFCLFLVKNPKSIEKISIKYVQARKFLR